MKIPAESVNLVWSVDSHPSVVGKEEAIKNWIILRVDEAI